MVTTLYDICHGGDDLDIFILFFLNIIFIYDKGDPPILYALMSTIFAITIQLINKKHRNYLYIFALIMSLFISKLFLFFPILFIGCTNIYIAIISALIVLLNGDLVVFATLMLSLYFNYRNSSQESILKSLAQSRDSIMKDALYLKDKNREIRLSQMKNEEITILNERNRISRELHDSIGHTISASILQVKSLSLIAEEREIKDGLSQLQNSLEKGMTEIRETLHQVHDTSFNTENKIMELLEKLPGVETTLNYRIESDISYEMKYDIIRIVRESISNFIKHSNGNKFNVDLLENKNFFLLVVSDNGYKFEEGSGMGLNSIRDIANKYHGFVNFSTEKGFKVHVALRREL